MIRRVPSPKLAGDDAARAEKATQIKAAFTKRQHEVLRNAIELSTHEPFRFVLIDALQQLGAPGRPMLAQTSVTYALALVDDEFAKECRTFADSDQIGAKRPAITRCIKRVANNLGIGESTLRREWGSDPWNKVHLQELLKTYGINSKTAR